MTTLSSTRRADTGARRTAAGARGLLRRYWPTPAAILLFFVLMWIGSLTLPRFIFPSVGDTLAAVWRIITTGYQPLLVTMARYLAALGAAVVDRLVEPLLGGVYAGQARRLSARACVPALYDAGRRGDSLVRTAARLMPAPDPDATPAPVFASVRGGVGVLADALGERLRDLGVDLRTGTTVRALVPTGRGWRLSLGDHRAGQTLDADAVVLATPARAQIVCKR